MANQNLNDWKFQIHYNKIWWVNQRTRIEQKNSIFVCLIKDMFENNNKTAH